MAAPAIAVAVTTVDWIGLKKKKEGKIKKTIQTIAKIKHLHTLSLLYLFYWHIFQITQSNVLWLQERQM